MVFVAVLFLNFFAFLGSFYSIPTWNKTKYVISQSSKKLNALKQAHIFNLRNQSFSFCMHACDVFILFFLFDFGVFFFFQFICWPHVFGAFLVYTMVMLIWTLLAIQDCLSFGWITFFLVVVAIVAVVVVVVDFFVDVIVTGLSCG